MNRTEVVTATIKREAIGKGKDEWVFLSSPDIPGFYLCYEDPEQSYRLVEPVARMMLWGNRTKAVKPQTFDASVLREKGIAILTFEVVKTPVLDHSVEEHGALVEHDTDDHFVFLPKIMMKGEEKFRIDVVQRIMRDNPRELFGAKWSRASARDFS